MANEDPSVHSSAYGLMKDSWRTIDDILAGPDAVRTGDRKGTYLPQYSGEGPTEYDRRRNAAPWRPEFVDILQTLSSKPFTKEIMLGDNASPRVKELTEDIDARGNNLTAFARGIFKGGIAKGLHAILVDYPSMAPGPTVASERAAGVRPYWVSIAAEDIIALYTTFVGGREIVQHVRIKETIVERDGFGERTVNQVRVLEPGLWQLWRQAENNGSWTMQEEGVLTLKEVPLALFWAGERKGEHFVRPPLASLADMQMELYRALSRQDEVLTYAGSPMLQAKGMQEGGPLELGPKRVLYAPPALEGAQPEFSYIQPDAAVLTEIRESIEAIATDMRRLGMQPLTQKAGGVTATASSIEGAKAHSTVEAWALALKDVLEQALVFTSNWLGESETAEVTVNTDFSVVPYAQAPLDALTKARAARDISQRTYWDGLKRFDVLAPDFDADAEELAVAEELEGLEPEIDPMLAAPGQ
jgi:hypothetical protein